VTTSPCARRSGSVTLPAETADLPDAVAWAPEHSAGVALRSSLGAGAGDLVTVSATGGASAPGAASLQGGQG
jgi:NADH-quinone oxidoreductase subunit G